MQTSRIVRTSLVSAIVGIGAVTALASTAGAATGHAQAPAVDVTLPSPTLDQPQDIDLSDGTVAHISHLSDGHWQAWITQHGTRIAALDAKHPSKKTHGFTYVLNQANGFVGVIHPGGWHSEQDVAPEHQAHKQHRGERNKDCGRHAKAAQGAERDYKALKKDLLRVVRNGGHLDRSQEQALKDAQYKAQHAAGHDRHCGAVNSGAGAGK
ncbi:hypothetical protein [Streptomyces sp. cg35]|uniref:hypothetical protein n=1 Tax=Streptomyces sp. cg35 TaxID=3421650 RepID=UPI003D1775F9